MTMLKPKRHTLRQAASLVFVLTAVLPLLMFSYSLYRLNGLRELEGQITLGLALVVALLGFYILRRMVVRISDLLRTVGKVREQGELPQLAAHENLELPGVGTIQEFHELAETVDHLWALWKAEAAQYLGRRVLVSVRNSPHPIAGTLVEVSDEGVLLGKDTQQVGISYRRVLAIEAARPG
ncbi:MAG: hypothetical protein ACE5JN_13615 [Candidatus Methylomirabilia bacterium]